jgi:hypothetical protein
MPRKLTETHKAKLSVAAKAQMTGKAGEFSNSWKGDDIGYSGAHSRIKANQGAPSEHLCIDCGRPAKDWSYDHEDPNQLTEDCGRYQGRPYSADPAHYVPRCRKCHNTFDALPRPVDWSPGWWDRLL